MVSARSSDRRSFKGSGPVRLAWPVIWRQASLCTTHLAMLSSQMSATFGGISIRSAYRSARVNAYGNEHGLNCASNERNYAAHIWDRRDADGCMGATACIVVRWFADRYAAGADWRGLGWWIHDHLPYSRLCFFPKLAAFNINWHERPQRRIDSFIEPKGCLTKPGMDNHGGDHAACYQGFPTLAKR
jgi:hypothetical protein